MVFGKKRNSEPQISPLPSPASTTPFPGPPQPNQTRGGRMSMSNAPQSRYIGHEPNGPGGPGSIGSGSGRSRHSIPAGPPNDFMAGPRYDANNVERVMSGGSVSKTEKGEKRKSGLFGFGKKKEEKKEEKKVAMIPVPEAESREGRHSFSVNRDHTIAHNSNPEYPQQMHQFPPPSDGHTPPPPMALGRIPSNPELRQNEFGANPAGVPKSQSMGFNQNNQQYRGPPVKNFAQGQQPQSLPKSQSMPLDKATPPTPKSAGSNRDRSVSATSAKSNGGGLNNVGQPAWLAEFTDIVELIGMQPQKTYVASAPELEMILARTSAGGQPKQGQPGSATNDWDSVWLQLSGISLSMWSMKETRAAAAKGEKVPPTYFNITDSSLELLAPLPPPPHRPNSHPHHHVFSLNTAGSNRLLFSCPTERDIARWATGMRLSAWERSRLEEIYTGHLIRSGGREPKVELVRGRLEGWVRVRIMGGTDWKRLWLILSTPNPPVETNQEDEKKSRRKSFFGGSKDNNKKEEEVIPEPSTGVAMASFYGEPRTQKNRSVPPVLTVTSVTQAYAVFPERLEVVSQSNLMKLVGKIAGEMVAIEGRLRESGWVLVMPETPEPTPGSSGPAPTPLINMMKWVTAVHDAFEMYGRPERYIWDEKEAKSLFFAYPRGTDRNHLFLDIDDGLASDYRVSSLPQIRSQFVNILKRNIFQPTEPIYQDNRAPQTQDADYRLPPLAFDQANNGHPAPRPLSPITERSIASREPSQRTSNSIPLSDSRNVSGSSQRAVSKQGSGSSNKLGQPHEQSQLETIDDADTTGGHQQIIDDKQVTSPIHLPEPTFEKQTSPDTTPLSATSNPMDNQTVESNYSRSTGYAPAASTFVSPINPPINDGGDLTPKVSASDTIHSPAPKKSRSTEFKKDKFVLNEEPAAQYLMNMVDEPPKKTPSPDKTRPTIITDLDQNGAARAPIPVQNQTQSRSNEALLRKPSGARAQPPKRTLSSGPREGSEGGTAGLHSKQTTLDIPEDTETFLAYAEESSPVKPTDITAPSHAPPPIMAEKEPEVISSSFAPNQAAAERKAKAEAAAEESQKAMNVPGGGKRNVPGKAGNWSEDEEDEDEDEPDSPTVETARVAPIPLEQPLAQPERLSSHQRATPRALPPVPGMPTPNGGEQLPQPSYIDRPRSNSPAARAPPQQYPSSVPFPANNAPPAAKQNMWNANFAAEHGMPDPNKSGKFVDLEEPQARLTQAFAPHGLLQAGIQDKEERSAKKQEEFARETGSSLVNVPSKPPAPSAGLLGAVAKHEEERKNAGGIGATLTDRERDKRIAEDRQREIEKLQRQQMEHAQRYGDFGQGGGSGFGYGMPPQMGMGMPQMGYNPYQSQYGQNFNQGYNPYAQQQAIFAAQMAYHHAMMSMSQSGSQAGGPLPNGSPDDRSASPISINGSQFGHGSYAGSPYPGQMPSMPSMPSMSQIPQMGHGQMGYGWPGSMPWMQPPGPGSPGMPGMTGMPQMPQMPFLQPPQQGYGPGGQGGGSGPGTPFDQRSRGDSFHSGRDMSQDRSGGAPAT